MNSPTVLEAKRLEIYSVNEDSLLSEACQQIASKDISCLVITNQEGYLKGILTRADLLRARLTYPNWLEIPISHLMSREVVTVIPETRLSEVAQLLMDYHIHRVVVVRPKEGNLIPVGVISDSDLIYHMAAECSC